MSRLSSTIDKITPIDSTTSNSSRKNQSFPCLRIKELDKTPSRERLRFSETFRRFSQIKSHNFDRIYDIKKRLNSDRFIKRTFMIFSIFKHLKIPFDYTKEFFCKNTQKFMIKDLIANIEQFEAFHIISTRGLV